MHNLAQKLECKSSLSFSLRRSAKFPPRKRRSSPIVKNQCVVYKFQCDLCDTDYVGYTTRHLQQRIGEHKHSATGRHLKRRPYLKRFDSFLELLTEMVLIFVLSQCIIVKLLTKPIRLLKNSRWKRCILRGLESRPLKHFYVYVTGLPLCEEKIIGISPAIHSSS